MQTFTAPLLSFARPKPLPTPDKRPIYWLDDLLEHELVKPISPPLVVVVSGPPGAGKSLLIQQICYERAKAAHDEAPSRPFEEYTSLYISTESTHASIRANLECLGMSASAPTTSSPTPKILYEAIDVEVIDKKDKKDKKDITLNRSGNNPDAAVPMFLAHKSTVGKYRINAAIIAEDFHHIVTAATDRVFKGNVPYLLAIDSLDVYEDIKLPDLIESIRQVLKDRPPQYLFLVADGPTATDTPARRDFWSYAADVSICIDYGGGSQGYFTRSVEIIKTRHQNHVLGRHVLKIFPWIRQNADSATAAHADPEDARPFLNHGGIFVFPSIHRILSLVRGGRKLVGDYSGPLRPVKRWSALPVYANGDAAQYGPGEIVPPIASSPNGDIEWSPYKLGCSSKCGLALNGDEQEVLKPLRCKRYSSQRAFETAIDTALAEIAEIRRYAVRAELLSATDVWSKRETPQPTLNWPLKWCYELVGGGVPLNKCTALIGRRGTRKSYFGYQFIYDGMINGENTMVVSFRDDPAAVKDALSHISNASHYNSSEKGEAKTPQIVFQRPGYVTPEEFMHRIIACVGEYSPTRVLVNAVDQWSYAYPLLARCELLLPCMVDFFGAHEVTSMIVGVEENAAGADGQGLTSQAEVVLAFEWHRLVWPKTTDRTNTERQLPTRASLGPAIDGFPSGVELLVPDGRWRATRPKVVIRAVRVPRAAAGFGRAVLEFESDATGVAGLTMRPLAPEYPEGRMQ